jgi:hypothetical protein
MYGENAFRDAGCPPFSSPSPTGTFYNCSEYPQCPRHRRLRAEAVWHFCAHNENSRSLKEAHSPFPHHHSSCETAEVKALLPFQSEFRNRAALYIYIYIYIYTSKDCFQIVLSLQEAK